jgi:zinc protease
MQSSRVILMRLVIVWLLLAPNLAPAMPEIQHWRTANGARVYFVPAPELPIVDVRVVFDAGSARDGDKPGLAVLTNALLDSGTETLSVNAVAERLDDVGARLGAGAMRDMAWLSLRSLSGADYLLPGLDTVSQLLREPAFKPESLERERNRLFAALQGRNQSPGDLAQEAFFKALYGDHPYASPPEGNETSLNAITREDLLNFHQRYYVAANAVVAIVGDLNRGGAEKLATTLVGQLPVGEAAPPLPAVEPVPEARTIRISHPSSQSHILSGQVGVARGDPDYFSLYLGNHVFGGNGLVSKLSEEIREKRGLSYSVYSYFSPMRQAGPFIMGLQTRNDQVNEAIQVMDTTLDSFVKNGPDSEALQAARQNITGGFALRTDSNSKIVQYLAAIGFYGLPLDYLQTFTAKIDALSQEQVSDALERRLRPDRLITVIVGKQ